MNEPINLESKFTKFSDYWAPKVIAQMNDYQFKLVKIKGEYVSRKHDDTDEVFIVIEGKMSIQLSDKKVHLRDGEMIVISKGEQHQPFAEEECKILLIEPNETINSGDDPIESNENNFTSPNNYWI
jgi:mannose-6-phosphate isomerase-like protein (cupin superfamily)